MPTDKKCVRPSNSTEFTMPPLSGKSSLGLYVRLLDMVREKLSSGGLDGLCRQS